MAEVRGSVYPNQLVIEQSAGAKEHMEFNQLTYPQRKNEGLESS